MIQTLKLWLGLMIAIVCAGCQAQGNFPTPVITVEMVTVSTTHRDAGLLACPGCLVRAR